jgi:hypothetical protein
VAQQVDTFEIIHPRPSQPAVVEDESARFDQVDGQAETGGQPQHGAGVLGNIRLKDDKAHGEDDPLLESDRFRRNRPESLGRFCLKREFASSQ